MQVTYCSRGGSSGVRRAVFRASMDSVPGAKSMSMRFILKEQVGRGPSRRVKAPELAGWRHSRPGVARFTYRQRVLPLETGVTYRMIVRFRWHDEAGGVIGSARRRSARCSQGRALPNLAVTAVAVRPGPTALTARYRVTVSNSGRARAKGAEIALLVDGDDVDHQPFGPLLPDERRRVWFVGPVCAASIEARVDPDDLVRESSEEDNARLTPCPAGS